MANVHIRKKTIQTFNHQRRIGVSPEFVILNVAQDGLHFTNCKGSKSLLSIDQIKDIEPAFCEKCIDIHEIVGYLLGNDTYPNDQFLQSQWCKIYGVDYLGGNNDQYIFYSREGSKYFCESNRFHKIKRSKPGLPTKTMKDNSESIFDHWLLEFDRVIKNDDDADVITCFNYEQLLKRTNPQSSESKIVSKFNQSFIKNLNGPSMTINWESMSIEFSNMKKRAA